ncbi:hypothetical protein AB1Y20_000421 [Prymnesium parvum]|uniref:Beta-fructofuranosidase n=1 Tax=Prymnesium parvum TaxID=97485 RepID=A0AB34K6D3_PRYPA
MMALWGGLLPLGLMFHSTAVTKQWDTWGFVENGTWYAYYLVTEHSPGEGFGVATSSDGVHWTDRGFVWRSPAWRAHGWWEGTSSVWRAPDYPRTGRYLINYSEYRRGGNQTITFAESFDLIHWRRPPPLNGTYFPIDVARGYEAPGRWDTIYSVPVPRRGQESPRDGYPRYGFWTATSAAGSWGAGVTEDGVHWQALAPTRTLPRPVAGEIGAVEFVPYTSGKEGGRWVGMLGYGWPRTMLTYTAPSPLGPYTLAARNANSLNGSCYFSRFLRGPRMELLVTHQTWTYRGTHVSYVSPYKLAHLDDDGTFRLAWYAANARLKGAPLPAAPDPADPLYLGARGDVSEGVLMEAAWAVPPAAAPADEWPGFLVEQGGGLALYASLAPDGAVGVGDYRRFVDAAYAPAGASLGADAPGAWLLSAGSGLVPTAVPADAGVDLRSGGPGDVSRALLARPLDSAGHLLDEVRLSFQYVAGYTPPPGQQRRGATVSVSLVDAHNGSHVAALCTTAELSNYSFDRFTAESPPVHCGASALRLGWPRQMAILLTFHNHERNVQIPLRSIRVHVQWGGAQPGPYAPSPVPPTFAVRERWSRDFALGAAGASVAARLLYRRGMMELYLHDFLYPVFSDFPGTGRFGVTSRGAVSALRWWRMSLPADPSWDDPSRQPPEDSPALRRAKFGLADEWMACGGTC